MLHNHLRFVDLAVNGAKNRNNPVDLTRLEKHLPTKVEDRIDCYTSMYRFEEAFVKHVTETKSVRGAERFIHWSDYLWFDIDRPEIKDAVTDMKKFIRNVPDILVKDAVLFFSGKKGFHFGLNAYVLGLNPGKDCSFKMLHAALAISNITGVTIDKVYDVNRLWRIPNTIHSGTGLIKRQLFIPDFLQGELTQENGFAPKEKS